MPTRVLSCKATSRHSSRRGSTRRSPLRAGPLKISLVGSADRESEVVGPAVAGSRPALHILAMELSTLASLAEVFGALVVVGSIAFAVVQLAHFRRQRSDMAAVELARSFQTPEFTHAIRVVLSLPDGATAEQVQSDPRYEDAAMLVSLTLESVGIMVHRRMVSIEMVWELMGGMVLAAWRKMQGWAQYQREQQGGDKFDEWIQWLCEQLESLSDENEPAYRKYRDWRPRSASLHRPAASRPHTRAKSTDSS